MHTAGFLGKHLRTVGPNARCSVKIPQSAAALPAFTLARSSINLQLTKRLSVAPPRRRRACSRTRPPAAGSMQQVRNALRR